MGNMNLDATPQDICTRAGYTKEKALYGSDSLYPLIATPSLHTPSPECQPHSGNKSARRSGVNRSRPGRGKDAAGILDARCRIDAVGNVVRGSDVGLVEHVLDLEEEDRALEIVICDVGVVVNVEI